ncbi:MAG: DUF1501 domain-containing protein [Pseudomonadota bacterium]
MINRRDFLMRCCSSLGTGAAFASTLGSFNAIAADVSDYKALVCVFLFGGIDCHDTIIPYDNQSYNDWEGIREPILASLDANAPRRRSSLLELTGADIGGRQFAFPSEFGSLHQLYQQGQLAVVGNVGPLVETVTRTTFRNDSAALPPRLFSHNDQQSIWMANSPEGARFGWGGRIADFAQAAMANSDAAFTAISAGGNAVLLTGETVQAFQVSESGPLAIQNSDSNFVLNSNQFSDAYSEILRDEGISRTNLFDRDFVGIRNLGLTANDSLSAALSTGVDPTNPFPDSRLGRQLNIVARIISRQATLGARRQVFFVSTGGFDTHSDQADDLPGLQSNIDASISAFYTAIDGLNMSDKVTTFTASDFGRTLSVNGDGTDHGWGGHHLVLGGAVNGGQIIGNIPPAAFNHEFDTGRGRLIPQISVDQYAAALGSWFGLSNTELMDVLPGLGNFDGGVFENLFV